MSKKQNQRLNFAGAKNSPNYPDFLDIQIKSFQFFNLKLNQMREILRGYLIHLENFPITDTRNQFVLEFLDYFVDLRYNIKECIDRGLTYSFPLKARLKLFCTDPDHEDFETIVQDVFRYNTLHDSSGTFVINGAEE